MLLGKHIPAANVVPTPKVERVLQIGEGRFIRGFVGWLLQRLHNAGLFDGAVVLTPARASGKEKLAQLARQDNLYTVWTRGLSGGARVDSAEVISIISRRVNPFEDWRAFLTCAEQESINIVVSNTTEMGITYTPTARPVEAAPQTYPARLTAYLKHRFDHFGGATEAGLVILPCELIEDNGDTLRRIVLRHAEDWRYGRAFQEWVEAHSIFCNTLVDRITPGFPRDDEEAAWRRLGYEDRQLVITEPYYIWAIEAHERVSRLLPFQQTNLNVVYTDDPRRYRVQKLRVLNGAHTFMAAPALWLGLDTVRDAMTHPLLGQLIHQVVDQVVAPHSELDESTLREYAATIYERFLNPYIDHFLKDITLYSIGKWRIRLLPVLARYHAMHGCAPPALNLSLAALLLLYAPDSAWPIEDTPEVTARLSAHWTGAVNTCDAVPAILADTELWGRDAPLLASLAKDVSSYVNVINDHRLAAEMRAVLAAG